MSHTTVHHGCSCSNNNNSNTLAATLDLTRWIITEVATAAAMALSRKIWGKNRKKNQKGKNSENVRARAMKFNH